MVKHRQRAREGCRIHAGKGPRPSGGPGREATREGSPAYTGSAPGRARLPTSGGASPDPRRGGTSPDPTPGRPHLSTSGKRSQGRRRCHPDSLSRADSSEENERIIMKRKGHFSHFTFDFMCFIFFKSFNQPLNNEHPNQGQTAPSFQNNRGKITKLKK